LGGLCLRIQLDQNIPSTCESANVVATVVVVDACLKDSSKGTEEVLQLSLGKKGRRDLAKGDFDDAVIVRDRNDWLIDCALKIEARFLDQVELVHVCFPKADIDSVALRGDPDRAVGVDRDDLG